MASAYKSAMRSGDSSDSDETRSVSSEQSSNTVQADSPGAAERTEAGKKNLSQLPLEIRNRVLMLTSRGVSYRSDETLTLRNQD